MMARIGLQDFWELFEPSFRELKFNPAKERGQAYFSQSFAGTGQLFNVL
jgi:hypothetical protein